MRIGELAKATHCSVETIRYYEREGLLPTTTRSDGNYRNYTARHAERLRFVRNCRVLDMAQGDIRELLNILDHPSNDCASVNKLVDRHFDRVEIRIRELESLRRQLAELRRRCQAIESVEACGILRGLSNMNGQSKSQNHSRQFSSER